MQIAEPQQDLTTPPATELGECNIDRRTQDSLLNHFQLDWFKTINVLLKRSGSDDFGREYNLFLFRILPRIVKINNTVMVKVF